MTTTNSSIDNNYRKNNGRIYRYTYKFENKATAKADKQESSNGSSSSVTLLGFLSSASSNFGKAGWKRRILRGEISVEGSIVTDIDFSMTSKQSGCCLVVSYHRPPWQEPIVEVLDEGSALRCPDANSLQIMYQDDDMIAVHKPSGLPTMHSQTFCDYTVLNALRSTTSPTYAAPPQPVHRLGVGTSGVLLIATSIPARQALSRAIRDKHVTKVYRALVTGADTIPDALRIDCPIGPVPFPINGGTIYAACPVKEMKTKKKGKSDDSNQNEHNEINEIETMPGTKGAKESLSLVNVVRRNLETNEAVVDVEIPTGRPHQIRIHMAYAGHPLVGDPLYLTGGIPDCRQRLFPKREYKEEEDMDTDDEDGGDDKDNSIMRVPLPRDCGYSLHAHRITVQHPVLTNDDGGPKWMTFIAPPPANLA